MKKLLLLAGLLLAQQLMPLPAPRHLATVPVVRKLHHATTHRKHVSLPRK
ncbi:hypothetical protein KLP40_04785 [Hymenobacter sp. NST-14]|nr:hypothetical protein [Hymenobacter piscis]MBT9392471.1 hypothetical protein [Hymenobacter piscis]